MSTIVWQCLAEGPAPLHPELSKLVFDSAPHTLAQATQPFFVAFGVQHVGSGNDQDRGDDDEHENHCVQGFTN